MSDKNENQPKRMKKNSTKLQGNNHICIEINVEGRGLVGEGIGNLIETL